MIFVCSYTIFLFKPQKKEHIMRSILKMAFYFTALFIMSVSNNCCASYGPPGQPKPGSHGIYPEVEQWPAGSYTMQTGFQPVSIHHQDFSYQPDTSKPDTSGDAAYAQALAEKFYNENHPQSSEKSFQWQVIKGRGFYKDHSGSYNTSTVLNSSYFEEYASKFIRDTCGSSLFVFNCRNTYKKVYKEKNSNSTLIRIAFFNTYEKGKTIDNRTSSRLEFCIGDTVHTPKNFTPGNNDDNSTHFSFSIDKHMIAVLLSMAVAFKYGLFKMVLIRAGISLSQYYVIPVIIGAGHFVPILPTAFNTLGAIAMIGGFAPTFCVGLCGGALLILQKLNEDSNNKKKT